MFRRPLDTRAHHQWREARLVYDHSVLNNGKIDVRDLENIPMQIALEDALSSSLGQCLRACIEVSLSCSVFEPQTCKEGHGRFRSFKKRGCVDQCSSQRSSEFRRAFVNFD